MTPSLWAHPCGFTAHDVVGFAGCTPSSGWPRRREIVEPSERRTVAHGKGDATSSHRRRANSVLSRIDPLTRFAAEIFQVEPDAVSARQRVQCKRILEVLALDGVIHVGDGVAKVPPELERYGRDLPTGTDA